MKIQIKKNEFLKNMPPYLKTAILLNIMRHKTEAKPNDTVGSFVWTDSIENKISPGFDSIWSQISQGIEVSIPDTVSKYWFSLHKIFGLKEEMVFTTGDYREYKADLNGKTIKITLQVE